MSRKTGLLAVAFLALAGCAGTADPPNNVENACAILEERPDWYAAARTSTKKWKTPTVVMLAIIWRESSFRPAAKPPRTYFLGFIPTGRQSSAYGFSQAIDGTWDWYKRATRNRDADRTDFSDAVDFVGWYMTESRKRLGLPMRDAMGHYLAYHEGHGGFESGGWKEKAWLKRAAQQVSGKATLYDAQLRGCDSEYALSVALKQTPLPKAIPFALAQVSGTQPTPKPASDDKKVVPATARTEAPKRDAPPGFLRREDG